MESLDTLALPTISALRHLEPRPGGHWTVTGHSSASYTLAYIMDGGADAICYTMKLCATEEDVLTHCGSLIYDYSEVNAMGCDGLKAATQNAASGPMHIALHQKQDTRPNDPIVDLALDPLMIDPVPEPQNLAFSDTQQSRFGSLDQIDSHNLYELINGSTNNQSQQQMMGAVNNSSVAPGNESNALLSDLWDENYDKVETLGDDAVCNPAWPVQFATS
ncbi:uncharacterized protein MAM_01739 [Metarhizium album ARSEF 1941]|uniref:Uncharacterized protein n=1 Tax=Metarhizium album (strain ARSEF 1941) TaxID=1081103 RepID=A0A0B2X6P2_METAS|nr:uncharacterized protein MAM_01739 [Metarhizium album ARSEF 1941]KHO00961.1 hypothetical protein MAM_01739 [Metarhizium album ARSEF 1941]